MFGVLIKTAALDRYLGITAHCNRKSTARKLSSEILAATGAVV